MSEPTSADVRAAVDVLKAIAMWSDDEDDHDAAIAALALLTERLARLEAYAVHKHECAIRLPHLRPEPHPCDCGLAALLQPATETT